MCWTTNHHYVVCDQKLYGTHIFHPSLLLLLSRGDGGMGFGNTHLITTINLYIVIDNHAFNTSQQSLTRLQQQRLGGVGRAEEKPFLRSIATACLGIYPWRI